MCPLLLICQKSVNVFVYNICLFNGFNDIYSIFSCQTEKFQDFSPCWISKLYWKLWDAFTSITLIKFTNVVCFSSGFYNRCAYGYFFLDILQLWDTLLRYRNQKKDSILRYKNELKFRSFDITQDALDISLPFSVYSLTTDLLSTVLTHINYVQFDYMQESHIHTQWLLWLPFPQARNLIFPEASQVFHAVFKWLSEKAAPCYPHLKIPGLKFLLIKILYELPTSIHVHMYACICTHMHTHIYIYTHTHIYICIYTYTHTYVYIHTHIHIYTYVYIIQEVPTWNGD